MPIRLVVLDADESLWKGRVGRMELPFERLDENTVSDSCGQTVALHPKTRGLLVELRKSGIAIGMASWNYQNKAEEALNLLGILEFFPDPLRKIWHERGTMKHLMIQEIVEEVRKKNPSLKYSEVLFYDDDRSYFNRVHRLVSPDIHCVQAGVDLGLPYEILGYVARTR
jgi:magnesium-dependent phosphatase-1